MPGNLPEGVTQEDFYDRSDPGDPADVAPVIVLRCVAACGQTGAGPLVCTQIRGHIGPHHHDCERAGCNPPPLGPDNTPF